MRNKASTDTGAIYSIGMSVFNGAPQKEYVSATCGSPCEYAEIFESAVNAFANEARVAFEISSNKVGDNVKRYASPRAFIIKLMLAIGLLPHDNSFAVIAKLVETLCLNPQIRLNDAIMRFAEAHGSTVDAVTRAIEKSLDAYDEKLIQRVTAFTQSRPMTAKDIICDIAVYVRAKYIDGKMSNEQYLGQPVS